MASRENNSSSTTKCNTRPWPRLSTTAPDSVMKLAKKIWDEHDPAKEDAFAVVKVNNVGLAARGQSINSLANLLTAGGLLQDVPGIGGVPGHLLFKGSMENILEVFNNLDGTWAVRQAAFPQDVAETWLILGINSVKASAYPFNYNGIK